MSAHCAPTAPTFSYFVTMIDHGRKGREAVVDPESTRRDVIARIVSGEYPRDRILFIHEISDDARPVDILADILAECDAAHYSHALKSTMDFVEQALFDHDHARDLRKHEVVG